VVSHASGLASEITSYRFRPDGSFVRRFVTDSVDESSGDWWLHETGAGAVLLLQFLETTERDVLSLAVLTEGLRLGERLYEPVDPIAPPASSAPEVVGPGGRRGALPDMPDFPFLDRLVSSEWLVEGGALPGYPDRVLFDAGGGYQASFEERPCRYAGTFSLLDLSDSGGRLRMSVPANRCESGAPAGPRVREMPVHWRPPYLFLHEMAYRASSDS